MGPGVFGRPANAPLWIILQVLIIVCCSSLARSAECKAQLCSRQYSRAVEEGAGVAQGPTHRYCSLLKSYAECVRATARSCRGDLAYHSVQSLVAQWTRAYDCAAVLERGPGGAGAPGRHRPPKQQQGGARAHQECAAYRSPSPLSHCALFGDPHLRTFYDELQTCSVPGAWPLLDNPHVAVQVTNEPVGKGSTATAITKVTVIVRAHGPCAVEKTYEAQADSLPGHFTDGSKWAGPGVRVREESPGRHVEIHLRYVSTRIVVRLVGRYLTFAARMPSAVAVQGAQREGGGASLELCVRGCPRRQRIDFEQQLLDPKNGPKNDAIAACKALNVTDFYFDACVFDLLTTGDGSFSAAARDAMLDAPVNRTLNVAPRAVESGAPLPSSANLVLIVGLILMLVARCLVNR